MTDRLQQGVTRNELPAAGKTGLKAVRVKRAADGRGMELDETGESNRVAWQTPDGKLHSTAIGAYGHLKQNRHLVEPPQAAEPTATATPAPAPAPAAATPKARRKRASRAGMSLIGIVARAGGITPRSVKDMASYKEDILEAGLLHVIRKNGTDISKMAEMLEQQGHFRTPPDRHADDYLLELMAKRSYSQLASENTDFDREQEEFYRAQQAQENENDEQRDVEEVRRSNEEIGRAEGEDSGVSENAGWHQSDAQGTGGETPGHEPEDEYDRSEPTGPVDTGWDEFAPAAQDEPGFTGTDAEGREWRDGELVHKQDEPAVRVIPPAPEHLPGWQDSEPVAPPENSGWSEQETRWHSESQERVRQHWPALREQYIGRMGKFDGQGNLASLTLNTDEWRGHFEGYQGTNSHIFQDAASYANKRLLHEAFVLMQGKGNNTFLMLGGGSGSGKSSAMKLVTEGEKFPVIFDTVASNHADTKRWFATASGHGFGQQYMFVDRDPAAAWRNGVVQRAVDDRKKFEAGDQSSIARTVPLGYVLQSNLQARQTALEMLTGGDIPTIVVSNNGEFGAAAPVKESPKKLLRDGIAAYNESRLLKELFDETRRLHESGAIPGDIAQGLIGHLAGANGQLQLRYAEKGNRERAPDEREPEKNLGGVPGQGPLDTGNAETSPGLGRDAKASSPTAGQDSVIPPQAPAKDEPTTAGATPPAASESFRITGSSFSKAIGLLKKRGGKFDPVSKTWTVPTGKISDYDQQLFGLQKASPQQYPRDDENFGPEDRPFRTPSKFTEAVMPDQHAAKIKLIQSIITRMGAKAPAPKATAKKTPEASVDADPRVKRIRELLAAYC